MKDLRRSRDFYTKLGFRTIDGNADEGWLILSNGELRLGLNQGHIETNLLNFRGGDVHAVARALRRKGLRFERGPSGDPTKSVEATLLDPDGNVIYFNTFANEREAWRRGLRVPDS